jgi:hypothetical protein
MPVNISFKSCPLYSLNRTKVEPRARFNLSSKLIPAARQTVKALFGASIQSVAEFRQHRANPPGDASPIRIIIRQVCEQATGPALLIRRAEDNAPDAVKQQRSRTHHAGLKRRVAGHPATQRPQVCGHMFESLYLSMTAWMIMRNQDGIPGFGDDACVERDDRADWQIAETFGFERHRNGAPQVSDVLFVRDVIERFCHPSTNTFNGYS